MEAQREYASHVTWRGSRFGCRTTIANDLGLVAAHRPRARPGPSILALWATALVITAAEPARAVAAPTPPPWTPPKLSLTADTWIQFGVLGQFMYEAKQANAGDFNEDTMERDSWSNEVFVRRLRMIAQGALVGLPFYVSSDTPNLGKGGTDSQFFLNDAMLAVPLIPDAARLIVGRMLVPFSFENLQPAGGLLGTDYNLNALKLPPYIKAPYRDNGVQLAGVLAGNWIEYRTGIFASRNDLNDVVGSDQGPRVTGRVMLNLADPQTGGWWYWENALGTKTTSAIGAGFDYQKNGGPYADRNYWAWVVDGVFDRPVGSSGQVLSFAVAYYGWNHASDNFTGQTASAQCGWLLWNWFQPVLRWEHQNPDRGSNLDTYHVGLNFYLYGANANLKTDFAFGDRRDAAGHYQSTGRVQLQIFL